MLDALLTNLLTGLRLALPLRTDPGAVHPGVAQIALLAGLLLGLVVAADTLSIPAPRVFVGHALAYHATRMLLLVAVAWALVRLAAPSADLDRVLTLIFAGLVLPTIAYAVSTRYPLDAQL
ncbi:MAG: hypothetical protein KJO38_03520, partial [Gammaproteobacteria bacterium]|nr:hypothetical protein [Gammaproteobacteria bacterium]